MPNWCYIKIDVTPLNDEKKAKIQLEILKKKIEDSKQMSEDGETYYRILQALFPMPESLNITSGVTTEYGVAVLLSTKFDDHTRIDIINNYQWAKDMSRDDLIIHLVEKKMVNFEEAEQAIENVKKYGCETWYEWKIGNWGTKWDIKESKIEPQENSVTIDGCTAWSPPIFALLKISKDFDQLQFQISYEEECGGFSGEDTIVNGDICQESYERGLREE